MNNHRGSFIELIMVSFLIYFLIFALALFASSFQSLIEEEAPSSVRIFFEKEISMGMKYIFSVREDGTDERILAHVNPHHCRFHMRLRAVSPNGKHVLFHLKRNEAVCVVNADGSGLKKIGTGFPLFFSPDGQSVAILLQSRLIVSIVDLEGKIRDEWPLPSTKFAPMQYSTDGRFVHVIDPSERVFDFDSVTGELLGLSATAKTAGLVSPDGQKIISMEFVLRDDGSEDEFDEILFIVDADGTNKHILGKFEMIPVPIWSRDGMRLLVSLKLPNETYSIEIFELDPERTRIVQSKPVLISSEPAMAW